MFYRKYKDPGEDWEEITEQEAREKLEGNYKNIDLVIAGMKAGGLYPTCSAFYQWSESVKPTD